MAVTMTSVKFPQQWGFLYCETWGMNIIDSMSSQIVLYLSKVSQSLASGHATEHSYRPELRDLFVALTKYNVINEPKGSEHGKPDFIFLSGQ